MGNSKYLCYIYLAFNLVVLDSFVNRTTVRDRANSVAVELEAITEYSSVEA